MDTDEKLSYARGLCAGSSDFQRGDFIGFYTTYHYKLADDGNVNKYRFADNPMLVQTTPRPEAIDPVQVMPPNTTPRSRQISRGESKIAARVESAATAKAAKDEL